MFRLHGAQDEDCAIVRTALFEKGLEFEQVAAAAGTAPRLGDGAGAHGGRQAILDHLEAICPAPALLPPEPAAAAAVRALSRTIEQSLEGPLRGLSAAPDSAGKAPDGARAQLTARLDAGLAAVRPLARFEPWIAGALFTQADIVWYHVFGFADRVATAALGRDLLAEIDPAAAHREAVAARSSVQRAMRFS